MTIETFPVGTFRVGPKDDPDRYCLGLPVGAGAEGTLYRGSLTIDAGLVLEVAIKMLHPHHRPRLAAWQRRWGDQVELLRSVHAPGLVAVRDGFVGALPHLAGGDDTADTLYLVMNFIDGVPVDVWAGDHPDMADRDKLRLLLPIAAGLDLMHSGAATGGTPVIHGDVKPGNILVTDEGATILVDFGMMRSLPGGIRQTSIAGTTNYIAPEVATDGLYTPAADRYSFGGVAYYLLTGRHPTSDVSAMRLALEEGGRDAEVVDHVLRMFLAAALRPGSLANWCAQLRDSSLELPDGADTLTLPPPAPLTRPAPGEPTLGSPSHADLLETRFSRPPTRRYESPADEDARPGPATRKRRAWKWAAAAVFVTVALVAAVIWGWSPAASAPIEHYAFSPAVYPDGLVVAREWSLTGSRADRLHARLRVTNGSDTAVTGTVDEVITKSLAERVTAIRFLPDPDLVVRSDPVVRYTIRSLQPRHAVDFVYDIAVPRGPAAVSRLEGWAGAETEEEAGYRREVPGPAPATLTALAVNPPTVSVPVGQSYQLSPAGSMSDGNAASAFVLSALVWISDDASRVGVDSAGRITANRPGATKVTAQAGILRAEVGVTVTVTSTRSSGSEPGAVPPVTFQPPAVTLDLAQPVRGSPGPRTTPETTTPVATTPGTTPPATTTPATTALASQAIDFRDPGGGAVGTSAPLSAVGGPSGRPVVFSVGNPGAGVCTLVGATVTYLLAGNCVIDADEAGDAHYAAAPRVTHTVVVRPGSQAITFKAPASGVVGKSVVLSATGGASAHPVVFSVDPTSAGVCAVSGVNNTTLTFTASGDCVVYADQDGGPNYNPAPRVSRTIPVTAPGPVPLKVDDTVVSGTNSFGYTGAWIATTGISGLYQGTGHHDAVAGDSFTFTFTGTQASWWGGKGPNSGQAAVYLDGVLQTTVDAYRSVRLDNLELYRTQVLASGTHTITVAATTTPNPASGGITISVDYGTVLPAP